MCAPLLYIFNTKEISLKEKIEGKFLRREEKRKVLLDCLRKSFRSFERLLMPPPPFLPLAWTPLPQGSRGSPQVV